MILVTGFEPFGDRDVNSSAAVVTRLAAATAEAAEAAGGAADEDPAPGTRGSPGLATAVLPVTFEAAWPALRWELANLPAPPLAVLLLGQAAGRARVEVERIAINVADADTADNDGAAPRDEPVIPGGPAGIFATVPVRRVVEAVREAGVPTAISSSAGTYVCNALLYQALTHLEVPVGFVHLPLLPEQALDGGVPTMSLDAMVAAVLAAVGAIADALTS